MKMNIKKWIDELLSGPGKKPLPILSFPGVQLLGCGVRELVSDGALQAECMKAIAERYGTAASVSNMDLSVEAEAFGAEVAFSDDEVPTVVGRIIDTIEDAQSLKVPSIGEGRTGEYLKAIEKASAEITDRPIFAGVIGPFSLAGRLMDMTEIMIKCFIEPETAHATLKKAVEFLIPYMLEFKARGAAGVIMAEPAAGLLSPDLCRDFSSVYVRQIIRAVEDESFLFVYHNCGNVLPLADAIRETDARAFHFGNAVKLADMIDKFPLDNLIMGNVDPAAVLRNGTPEEVYRETVSLIHEMKGRPNFVLSSGCDIPPQTPLENIDAFFKAAREEGY